MAHTPGPWTVQKSGSFGWSIRGNWHGEEGHIAHVDAGICQIKGPFYDENKANGRLVAAAPDLLAALREMLDVQGRRKHPLGLPNEGIAGDAVSAASKARAAIAKVEGTPPPSRTSPAPRIYIVQGEHFEVPGIRVSAHTTRAVAHKAAAELVNSMLAELAISPVATAADWEDHIAMIHEATGDDTAHVWIAEAELLGEGT